MIGGDEGQTGLPQGVHGEPVGGRESGPVPVPGVVGAAVEEVVPVAPSFLTRLLEGGERIGSVEGHVLPSR